MTIMDEMEQRARMAGVTRIGDMIETAITPNVPGNVAYRIGLFWQSVCTSTLAGDDRMASAVTADLQLWLGKAGLTGIRELLDQPRWWLVN